MIRTKESEQHHENELKVIVIGVTAFVPESGFEWKKHVRMRPKREYRLYETQLHSLNLDSVLENLPISLFEHADFLNNYLQRHVHQTNEKQ